MAEQRQTNKDKFGVPYSEYPKCPTCNHNGRVGLNYIGLRDDENPHTRTDGGDTFYCYECCTTF